MSAIAFLRELLDAGVALDTALLAAEKHEQMLAAEPSRTTRQERNRRYYEKKKAEDDRLKASEKRLKTSESEASEKRLKASESVLNSDAPRAHVRDNPSRLVISGQTVVDVSVRAGEQPDDWPEGNPADALIAEVASPRLDPSKSQGLHLTAGRLVAWRRDGASWRFDVLPVVKAACAKAKNPIGTWKYFDTAISVSIAENRRALEIPDAASLPQSQGPPGGGLIAQIGAEQAEARRRAFELMDAREARNGR
jgi:hypothetical protein